VTSETRTPPSSCTNPGNDASASARTSLGAAQTAPLAHQHGTSRHRPTSPTVPRRYPQTTKFSTTNTQLGRLRPRSRSRSPPQKNKPRESDSDQQKHSDNTKSVRNYNTVIERGVYNNQVSAMLPTLPVGTQDPVERLQSVRAQMDRLKESGQAVAGEVLTSPSGFAPPLLLAVGGRLAARSPNLGVQTGVTNVPGPQQPLQTLGRRMLESFPFVPLIGNVRISIAIFSYNGGVYFGVTGDYDSSSDIDVLTAGVERGVAQLLKVSQAGGPAREAAPKRPKSEARRRRSTGAPPTQRA
jgi:hypothetical protein